MAMVKIEGFLKKLEKLPLSELCPLIDNVKWNCGKLDKGNEPCCHNTYKYMNCPHFKKWFYWNVTRMVAKEIAKLEISQKKK